MHNMHMEQKNSNIIREHAAQYVVRARQSGSTDVTIVAGEVVKALNLSNRVPAVCSALASRKFQEQNGIVLTRIDGPPSGQSTTSKFSYKISENSDQSAHNLAAFQSLRGAGKQVYAALGGGESFLISERAELKTL